MRYWFAILLLQAALSTQARVEPFDGILRIEVRSADSAPVAGVSITAGDLSGTTDEAGRLIFSGLSYGSYQIRAGLQKHFVRTGNQLSSVASASVTLNAAGRNQNVVFRVEPAASIRGRITDAASRPLSNVSVAAYEKTFRDGRLVARQAYVTTTSAQGAYVLPAVLPGTYQIAATASSLSAIPAPSYFPGVTTMEAAAQMRIRGSEQVVGIDFVLAQPPLFKVTGNVTNPPPNGVRNIGVIYRDGAQPDMLGALLVPNASQNAQAGEFELTLPPGQWEVFPLNTALSVAAGGESPLAGQPAYISGRASVDVTDRNVDGVMVTVGASDIEGRIVMDPNLRMPPGFSLSSMEIRIVPTDGTPPPLWQHAGITKVGLDARFKIPAVPPGAYRLQFSPVLANGYVSDIRSGQTSLFADGILHVTTARPQPLEIVFSAGGGTVQGTVQSATPSGSANSAAVALIPSAPRRQNALLYRMESLANGARNFSFANVPPGQYKIFAFDGLPSGGAELNAAFMNAYEQMGTAIVVMGSQTVRASVKMIEAGK